MTTLKKILAIGLFAHGVFLFSVCKKNPTTSSIDTSQQTIDLACEPASGAAGSTVTFTIRIAANAKEMRNFGLDVSFDNKMFQFEEVRRGPLTETWAGLDGNEFSPGMLRVGGFVGEGAPVPAASQGSLAEIRFKVTGTEYGNGQQSQTCAQNYRDHLIGFRPDPACSSFTLQK